jgi:hypothetical protein
VTDARKFQGTTGWTDLDLSRAARVERAIDAVERFCGEAG